MKHTSEFNDFLVDHVNLNPTRIATLKTRAETIKGLLKNSALLQKNFIDAREQGSWALKTIIKPKPDEEFDADIRIYLHEFSIWEPKHYINNIYQFFRSDPVYHDMVSRKTRCLTINYSGDFHLDIVPCIQCDQQFFVLNRNDNVLEPTDSDGYTEWFKSKNTVVGDNKLVKVVRLVKYLRNMKQTFTAKSILLTTLLTQQIGSIESDHDFKDLPTALCTICNRLDRYLQANMDMPTIQNPALPEEDFNRHWDNEKYRNFRQKWNGYTALMNSAFNETSRIESIQKWRRIFGDDFGTLNEAGSKTVIIQRSPTSPWTPK